MLGSDSTKLQAVGSSDGTFNLNIPLSEKTTISANKPSIPYICPPCKSFICIKFDMGSTSGAFSSEKITISLCSSPVADIPS